MAKEQHEPLGLSSTRESGGAMQILATKKLAAVLRPAACHHRRKKPGNNPTRSISTDTTKPTSLPERDPPNATRSPTSPRGPLERYGVDDFKYRVIGQPQGRLGVPSNLTGPGQYPPGSIRRCRAEQVGRVHQVVKVRVLALGLRPADGRSVSANGPRVPTHAEVRKLQPRGVEGGTGEKDASQRLAVSPVESSSRVPKSIEAQTSSRNRRLKHNAKRCMHSPIRQKAIHSHRYFRRSCRRWGASWNHFRCPKKPERTNEP